MKMNNPVLILGAGISGLGAAYKLSCNGRQTVVLEKDTTYGGLCGNFTIDGFRFDRFVHFSFAKDEQVNRIFMDGAGEVFRHVPNAYNLYQGIWIKHPAQNNLYPLSQKMKDAVVRDFLSRPTDIDSSQIENYDQWLRLQFGHFFAEHFPIPYTKKYWMTEAKDLETRWMGSREGSRLYQPSVEEVIRYNQQVISIDIEKRLLRTSEGDEYQFDRLISSLPLPEVIKMLKNVPVDVCNAATRLHCTCGYQISVGLKTKNIPPYLWWYIYDEDILPARVYSPSLKSPDNAPEGCSSLQMEVYCNRDEYTQEELLARSVGKLVSLNILKEEDILFTDIRFEPYANVIFDHNIYEARKIVRDYLSSVGIETIGRFGEWGYLWSDQSLMNGLKVEM